ncbi:YrhC family protein [Niallia circulans]|uniref:YrhC family protein n=1 Tax=Niallia circulans TaxID=1397 RepID=UPI003523A265
MEKKIKFITDKISDYQQFGTVLLAVGAIFYIGLIIPKMDKVTGYNEGMLITSIVFLSVSILFFAKVKKLKKLLDEWKES